MVDPEVFEMETVNRRWNGRDDDKMTIHENGRFRRPEKGLARHEQFDMFGSAITDQLFVNVIGEIYKQFKCRENVSSMILIRVSKASRAVRIL
jgi:hypothetical protein